MVAAGSPPALTIASGWTTSDRDGKFRIAGLAPAAFDLFVNAQDLATAVPVSGRRVLATSREGQRGPRTARAGSRAGVHERSAGRWCHGHSHKQRQTGGGRHVANRWQLRDRGSLRHDPVRRQSCRLDEGTEIKVDRTAVEGSPRRRQVATCNRGHVTRRWSAIAGADVMAMGAPQTTFPIMVRRWRGPTRVGIRDRRCPFRAGRLSAWDFTEQGILGVRSPRDRRTTRRSISILAGGRVKGTVVDQAGGPVRYVRMDMAGRRHGYEAAMTDANVIHCASVRRHVSTDGVAVARWTTGLARRRANSSGTINVREMASPAPRKSPRLKRVAIRGGIVDGVPIPDVYIRAIGRGQSSMDSPSGMTEYRWRLRDRRPRAWCVRTFRRALPMVARPSCATSPPAASLSIRLQREPARSTTPWPCFRTARKCSRCRTFPAAAHAMLVDGDRFSGSASRRVATRSSCRSARKSLSPSGSPGETAKVTAWSRCGHGRGHGLGPRDARTDRRAR